MDSSVNATNVIRRNTLIWLLISQVLVLLPFVDSHPIWLMLLLVLCLGWRGRALYRGDIALHPGIKYGVTALGLAVLYSSGYRQYDIDTMVAVVLLGFVLKTIETWQQRDALMVVFTGYFLSACHFVYSQTPWQAAYSICAIAALTACAISAHRPL